MTDNLTFGDALVQLPYLILALSYWLTSMYWLRTVAIAGMLLLAVFVFFFSGGSQSIAFWALVFAVINGFHLALLTREVMSLRLPTRDAPLLRESLSGLDDSQIARLLRAATWRDCEPGEILARQDAPLDALYFLCRGRANVEVNGSFVTYLEKGSFIGEIAYLTGNPATATVTVEEPSRLLVFSRMRMAKMVASDEQVSGIIYQLLGRDLAIKMRRANTRRVLEPDEEGIKV